MDIYLKASSLSKYPPIFNSTSMSIIIFIVKCCNDQLLGLKGVSKFFIKRWKSFWLKMRTTITAWVLISMGLFDCCRQYLPISTCTASPVITLHCCDISWTNKVELHASRCTVTEILKTYGILCLETKYKSVRIETVMTAANSKKESGLLVLLVSALGNPYRTVWKISKLMLWCKGLKVFLHLFVKFSIKSKEITLQKLHKHNYRVSNLEAKTNLPKQFNSCYPDRQNRLDHKGAGLQRKPKNTSSFIGC